MLSVKGKNLEIENIFKEDEIKDLKSFNLHSWNTFNNVVEQLNKLERDNTITITKKVSHSLITTFKGINVDKSLAKLYQRMRKNAVIKEQNKAILESLDRTIDQFSSLMDKIKEDNNYNNNNNNYNNNNNNNNKEEKVKKPEPKSKDVVELEYAQKIIEECISKIPTLQPIGNVLAVHIERTKEDKYLLVVVSFTGKRRKLVVDITTEFSLHYFIKE